MRRKVGLTLGLCFAAGYVVALLFVFQDHPIKLIRTDWIEAPGTIRQVYGNGLLQALLIEESGSADFIDADQTIRQTKLVPASNDAHFLTGMLSPSGKVFLMDDRKVLYRWEQYGFMQTSKPLKVAGDVLEIAIEESRKLLWCAMMRHEPGPDALMIYAINLENGKLIGSVNLEAHRGSVAFTASPSGEGVILSTTDTPGAFFFKCPEKTIESRFLDAGDLVNSALFEGTDVLTGLRSGAVARFDTETGHLKQTYKTDYLPVSEIALANHQLAIAHGDGKRDLGVGSLYLVDEETGAVGKGCGAKDRVTVCAGQDGFTPFVFGQRSGVIQVMTMKHGCQEVEASARSRPGAVHFIVSKWPTSLVVGSTRIERIEFQQ